MKCKKGYRQVKEKCKKVKKKFKIFKSKNNPFKMWGSYVGLVIGFTLLPDLFSTQIDAISYAPLLLIILWVIGFLIGWGIHSLVRKYKK